MNINDFAVLVTKNERGREEISIAQVKEVIKVIRQLLLKYIGLDLYMLIRNIKEK